MVKVQPVLFRRVLVAFSLLSIFSIPLCTAADTKFGIALVPQMNAGDDAEQAIFRAVGEMPEISQVFQVNDGVDMLRKICNIKRTGKTIDFLVIAGHGSRDTPGFKFGKDDMIPEEVNLEWNKEQLTTFVKISHNPGNSNLQPAEVQRRLTEHQQRVPLLEAACDSLGPCAKVILINCSAAATPNGQAFVKDFGNTLMRKRGGFIFGSKTDITFIKKDSISIRIATWVKNAFQGQNVGSQAGDEFIDADFQCFPITPWKGAIGRWQGANGEIIKVFSSGGDKLAAKVEQLAPKPVYQHRVGSSIFKDAVPVSNTSLKLNCSHASGYPEIGDEVKPVEYPNAKCTIEVSGDGDQLKIVSQSPKYSPARKVWVPDKTSEEVVVFKRVGL